MNRFSPIRPATPTAPASAVLDAPPRVAASPANVTVQTTTIHPTIPPSTNPPPPSPIRKLSFGKIAAKKEDTKTAYPVFPDTNGQAAIIAQRIIENSRQLDALEGALEVDKKELRMMTNPSYFVLNHGKHEVPSSIAVHSPAGEVLVTYQNRYPQLPDEGALLPLLGEQTERFFRQTFELKISGDKLPADLSQTQELLNELQDLFARFGATEALVVKAGIKPVADFHAARHTVLTPEQNLALEAVCPIVAMVKTKGRK